MRVPVNVKVMRVPVHVKVMRVTVNVKVMRVPVNVKVMRVPVNVKVMRVPGNDLLSDAVRCLCQRIPFLKYVSIVPRYGRNFNFLHTNEKIKVFPERIFTKLSN
jgi:hypothetical protein